MKRKTTSHKSLTDFERLRTMKDEDIVIDEDNPLLPPEAFARGVLRKGWKPVPKKELFSFRIDADVLEWFRGLGEGYQSRINALLRAYMEEHQKQDRRKRAR
ncbi:MAG: BrnA antitoxin family protein [Steroidobacteraceae bacterium]